jgi:hypothetical protein
LVIRKKKELLDVSQTELSRCRFNSPLGT